MNLSTAEGITRYLRSQDISQEDLIRSLNDLIDNDLIDNDTKVIPNINIFMFELIIDRINESKNKKFKDLKFDYRIWRLFARLWQRFDHLELKLKNNSLRRLKIAEVIIEIFNHKVDNQLIASLFDGIFLIVKSSFLDISLDDAAKILKTFLSNVLLSVDTDQVAKLNWTKAILRIYRASTANNARASSKKYLGEFSSSILPSLLKVCISESLNLQTQEIIGTIIYDSLLTQATRPYLLSNVKSLINVVDEKEARLVTCFYDKILITVDDTTLLQELFIEITKNMPALKIDLLERLSGAKRTLTTEFLSSLAEEELNSQKSNKLSLIHQIIRLDLGVAFKFAERIFQLLQDDTVTEEMSIEVSSRLIDSYVRAREFEEFYNVWIGLISAQVPFCKSDKFCELVSSNLSHLSSFQLGHLIKSAILPHILTESLTNKNHDYLIALVPLIEFAAVSTNHLKIETLKSDLFSVLSLKSSTKHCSKETSETVWKIRYSLLCLFEDSDLEKAEKFNDACRLTIAEAMQQLDSDIPYVFYSVFKIKEFYDFSLDPKLISAFVNFVKRADISATELCFNRWILIVNECFDEKSIISLVRELLSYNESKELVWKSIFSNDCLFEQYKVITEIINQSMELLEGQRTRVKYLNLINLIPAQCYNKQLKIKMIELLTKFAVNSGESAASLVSLSLLEKLLELPSFKSKIESEAATAFDLLKFPSSTEESKLGYQIFEKIWRSHTSQSHEIVHKTWIQAAIKKLQKFYKKSTVEKLCPEHLATAVVLLNSDLKKYDDLLVSFEKSVIRLLDLFSKDTESHTVAISWILKTLFKLDLSESVTLSSLRSSLKSVESSSENINLHIFNLLAKISVAEYETTIYMLTLYVILRPKRVAVDEGMGVYLSKLTLKEFLGSLDYVLQSFTDIEKDQTEYINLLSAFLGSYLNHKQEEENQKLQHYLTLTLSTILSSDFESEDSIMAILSILKVILTELGWSITQYSFELIVSAITKVTLFTKRQESEKSIDIYISNTQILSIVLLHHRHRLSGRHHLIMNSFTVLLESLFYKRNQPLIISESVDCGKAFQRLLTNLCEPGNIPQSTSTNHLSSVSSLLKKTLRNFLPVILINYINLQIHFNMHSKVREEILSGLFVIFDTLTADELVVVNSSLDVTGKTYLKILYGDYRKFGKWQEDV